MVSIFLYSFFFADLFSETAEIEVPSFIGMHEDEIRQSDYPNFRIQFSGRMPSDTVPVGVVMDQDRSLVT